MIRLFEKGDLPRLHQLDQICFPPEIAYSRAELRYFLTQPRSSCWVAQGSDGRITGFIIIERTRQQQQVAGHIVTLDTDPAARRQGIGSRLMHTAEAQMKMEGATHLRLEVAQNNTTAQQFYRSLGFFVRGRIPNYYGGRIDAEVMEKIL